MGRGRGKERRGEERWIRREGGDPRGGGEEKEERRGEERKGEGEGDPFQKKIKNTIQKFSQIYYYLAIPPL